MLTLNSWRQLTKSLLIFGKPKIAVIWLWLIYQTKNKTSDYDFDVAEVVIANTELKPIADQGKLQAWDAICVKSEIKRKVVVN